MRIIITGARELRSTSLGLRSVAEAVTREAGLGPHTIVHGDATGVDTCAEILAGRRGWTSERHPADWKRHGRKAGPIRNQAMADAGADLCLAFPLPGSRGTWDMVRRAEAAGIRTVVIES